MNQADGSAFWKAARAGDLKVVRRLLPQIDPKQPGDRDSLDRALAQAVFGRSLAVVDILLQTGADPNQKTSVGTLLSGAAMNGDLVLVKRLLAAGADLNREIKRETALSAALSENQVEVIKYLEGLGAYSPPSTTLFYACKQGEVERARNALAQGANVESVGGLFCETPLMVAARHGRVEIVSLLLELGAKPNKYLKHSCALFDAVASKSVEILELLVAAGADIHAKHHDETLIMAAAKIGCLPMVKRLVELGGDFGACDKNFHQTALDYARLARHKETVAYLTSLGARSDREAGRHLLKALAKEYGGKPVEYTHGIKLNSKFAGNRCEFHLFEGLLSIKVFKLDYLDKPFKRVDPPGFLIGPNKSEAAMSEVKATRKILGSKVMRPLDSTVLTEEFVVAFCQRHREFFQQIKLTGQEKLGITSGVLKFWFTETDPATLQTRLKLFEDFVRAISRPPTPARCWFAREWLLKPTPRASGMVAIPGHALGGVPSEPVACPHCGLASHLMARINLSDPALPEPSRKAWNLPVFWCLGCLEWDATFLDHSGIFPKAIATKGKTGAVGSDPARENDLPERGVTLVPIPSGRKAGRKSKLGGSPCWIQAESMPDCPKCEKPMAFILQLASDSRISYGDMGMLYVFGCPDCQVSASLIQSH